MSCTITCFLCCRVHRTKPGNMEMHNSVVIIALVLLGESAAATAAVQAVDSYFVIQPRSASSSQQPCALAMLFSGPVTLALWELTAHSVPETGRVSLHFCTQVHTPQWHRPRMWR